MKWKKATFLRALKGRPMPVSYQGWEYRGLGLTLERLRSAKTETPTRWCLTHIGTGHAIAFIEGEQVEVMPICAELAEEMDWSFTGLKGWQNMAPDMPRLVVAWMDRHVRVIERLQGSNSYQKDEILANKIANRSAK